ncbi:MAG: DUF1858 domain-containing protein [Ignavibacteria bacterium]|nr:DUF1858 domain-containing protein [Ignavibacteria bacterium]
MMNDKLLITPDIKIHEMLAVYPQLEDKLIEIVPAFVKLKNPEIKESLAKVTTLKQASVIGGVSVGKLINRLRMAVNQGDAELAREINAGKSRPLWVSGGNIEIEYDACEDLENGVHPVSKIINETAKLGDYSIYLLITPFTPVPLVDMLVQKRFDVYSEEHSSGKVHTYI